MNLRRILLSSVAALTLTSAAFAAGLDNGSTPTVVAQDGTGDYLLFPAYFANTSGWSTNIKITNANPNNAVIAKVVIRESVLSNEKLDFPIYLSPGDVFEGTLSNVGGNVILTSNDDSLYVSGSGATSVFANTSAVTKALASAVAPENNTMGYVEVFAVAEVAANLIDTAWTAGPLAKYKIREAFIGATVAWTGADVDSLFGQEVISANNGSGNLAMTLPATAFENVTSVTAKLAGAVIATDTTLTNASSIAPAVLLTNMEAAINKNDIFVTYYENADSSAMADTVVLLNQPMKKYRGDATLQAVKGYDLTSPLSTTARAGTNDTTGTVDNTLVTTAFNLNNYTLSYSVVPRDQSENTPVAVYDQWSGFHSSPTATHCNTELCYLNVAASGMSAYVKGWVDISVLQDDGSDNQLSVVPVVMSAKNVGGTNVTNIIYPAYR